MAGQPAVARGHAEISRSACSGPVGAGSVSVPSGPELLTDVLERTFQSATDGKLKFDIVRELRQSQWDLWLVQTRSEGR